MKHRRNTHHRTSDPEAVAAADSLKPAINIGGYFVDGTGFGKTITALLFASCYCLY